MELYSSQRERIPRRRRGRGGVRERGRGEVRRRPRGGVLQGFGGIAYIDDYYEEDIDDDINEINTMDLSLDGLILDPGINQDINSDKDKDDNLTLTEFKINNINKLYEEMLCYFSPPEIIKKI